MRAGRRPNASSRAGTRRRCRAVRSGHRMGPASWSSSTRAWSWSRPERTCTGRAAARRASTSRRAGTTRDTRASGRHTGSTLSWSSTSCSCQGSSSSIRRSSSSWVRTWSTSSCRAWCSSCWCPDSSSSPGTRRRAGGSDEARDARDERARRRVDRRGVTGRAAVGLRLRAGEALRERAGAGAEARRDAGIGELDAALRRLRGAREPAARGLAGLAEFGKDNASEIDWNRSECLPV